MNQTQLIDPLFLSQETSGIFESLRAYRGIIFRLDEHLVRFFESAKTLGIKMTQTRRELRQRLYKALRDSKKKDAFLRLTLLVGAERAMPLLSVIVTERIHPKEIYQKGVVLKTSAVIRSPSQAAFPEAKSTSCLNQILGTLDPAPPGNYEILFLDSDGYLTEARIGNLFIVKKDGGAGRAMPLLLTPPPHGLLNGVTRSFVIECARLGKIPVEESPLTRHELFNAQEAFLTNTSWEILPIREVDGRKIKGVTPGPVTKKLQTLFRREVEKEIGNAKN